MLLAETAAAVAESSGFDWVTPGLALLSACLVAYIGLLVQKRKSATDEDASKNEINQRRVETLIAGLSDRVEKLEERLAEQEEENETLGEDNRRLLALSQTQADLISGFTYWHEEGLRQWIDDGCPIPPGPPPYPWQVRQHLEQLAQIARLPAQN